MHQITETPMHSWIGVSAASFCSEQVPSFCTKWIVKSSNQVASLCQKQVDSFHSFDGDSAIGLYLLGLGLLSGCFYTGDVQSRPP